MTWKCPQCGEENKDAARMCGLCGELRPEEKPQEITARRLGPVDAPPPSMPVPLESSSSQQWRAQSAELRTAEEKQRFAEEAAAQILGRKPGTDPVRVSAGNWVMFIMFFPWSLLVLPMPGGMRNRNAGKVLLVIALVAVLLGIVSFAMMLHYALPAATSVGDQYKDLLNGQ